jgi:hypothetical protein
MWFWGGVEWIETGTDFTQGHTEYAEGDSDDDCDVFGI